MKIAIISDIHGNYQALKRCLEDSISQDVDAYIWLGDYLGEFPYPQDTMKTLYTMQTRYPCYFCVGIKRTIGLIVEKIPFVIGKMVIIVSWL